MSRGKGQRQEGTPGQPVTSGSPLDHLLGGKAGLASLKANMAPLLGEKESTWGAGPEPSGFQERTRVPTVQPAPWFTGLS